MCGRYGFSAKEASNVYYRFGVVNRLERLEPRYNIAPGTMNPVITKHSPNQISLMFWGLIPHWAKDESIKYRTINARADGIEQKPTYKKPLRFQRCLVPASGFYEWDKSTKPSVPYWFTVKGGGFFAMAGLYDTWTDPRTKEEVRSYTIITTEANGVVGKVHHRMPVILRPADEEFWLDPDVTEPERLLPLLAAYPDRLMEARRVSSRVNNPSNDSVDLIKPIEGQ